MTHLADGHLYTAYITTLGPRFSTILLSNLLRMMPTRSESDDVFIMIFSNRVSALRLMSFYLTPRVPLQ